VTQYHHELGLYDMSGNVWEWCWDIHSSYPDGTLTDYKGSSGQQRVFRGGSWFENAIYMPIDFRSFLPPESRYENIGFRVVRQ